MLLPRRRSGSGQTSAALSALHRFLLGAALAGLWGLAACSPAHAVAIRQAEWPLTQFHANRIWHISRGQGVTVAVIDSGVDAAHRDLKGQVLQGAGFIGDSKDKGQADISADSHGTAIAGIIAGAGQANHGNGMTGLAPKSKVLPVRVTTNGTAEPTALAEGIKYAADHHAQVINISSGMTTPDPLLREAVRYALGKDAVIVASAGNEGQDGNPAMYPAAFPGVIDVTGTDSDQKFWPHSESGPHSTLAAPAVDIYSTNNHGQYLKADGTSFAAAYVSAAAALVRSAFPQLSAGQTIRRLINTARPPGGSSHHDQYGYGLIDPLAALRAPASTNGSTANPLLTDHTRDSHTDTGPEWYIGTSLGGAAILGTTVTWAIVRRRRSRPGKRANPAPALRGGTSRAPGKSGKKKQKSRA